MLAIVPSCGATTGISIFMDSRIMMLSPAFTACPTEATTLRTLPGTEALTLTAPAPAAGAAAFGAAASRRSCLRCRDCFCSCLNDSVCGPLFYCHLIYVSIYCNCIIFHGQFLLIYLTIFCVLLFESSVLGNHLCWFPLRPQSPQR